MIDPVIQAYIRAHENTIVSAPKDDDATWKRLCDEAVTNGWRMYGFPKINGPWKEAIFIRNIVL